MEDKNITIIIKGFDTPVNFMGHYRRDLEKPNWHYYENIEKNLL